MAGSPGVQWVLEYVHSGKDVSLWVGDMTTPKVNAGNYIFQSWGNKEIGVFHLLNSVGGSANFYHERLATIDGCSIEDVKVYRRVLTLAERQAPWARQTAM